uniref:RNA polymerase subunit 5 n=1 Tax=Borely moumouvirus TaxID=2712067 RepID=A0A6G6AAS6_9VIRU
MEPNRIIFSIMKSDSEKVKTILTNILKMLSNRIYMDKEDKKQNLLNLENNFDPAKYVDDKGDNTFTLTTRNGDKYAIKIMFQKISAIGKQSPVSEFINEYNNHKKIIVAQEYNAKIESQVSKYGAQIFLESRLLSDLINNKFQPEFELLSPTEMKQFKTEYNVNEYTIKKYNRSDPVVQYFGLKKGDIIRIIRPSIVSGESIDYRIVT